MPETQFRKENDIIREAMRKCRIYSASYNPRYFYPFKLRSANNGWDALDESATSWIVDSDINDPSVGNEEVINDAKEMDAHMVIPKDYQHDAERTLKSLKEFEEIIEEKHDRFLPEVVPVLQDPHIQHLKENKELYSEYSYVAVGGLSGKKFDTEEKVRRIRRIGEILPDPVRIHAFGIGCSLGMIKAIRENPDLLYSLDMSTAEQMVMNGRVTDWTLNHQKPHPPIPYGEDKTTINAGFSKTILVMLNYMLTDRVNEEKLEEMFYEELELHKIQSIVESAKGEEISETNLSGLDYVPDDVKDRTIDEDQEKINSFG